MKSDINIYYTDLLLLVDDLRTCSSVPCNMNIVIFTVMYGTVHWGQVGCSTLYSVQHGERWQRKSRCLGKMVTMFDLVGSHRLPCRQVFFWQHWHTLISQSRGRNFLWYFIDYFLKAPQTFFTFLRKLHIPNVNLCLQCIILGDDAQVIEYYSRTYT